jgi:hypothetical protein
MYAAIVSFWLEETGVYGAITPEFLLRRPLASAWVPTSFGRGCGSSIDGAGAEYGTGKPGVRSVMEMAKVEGSGFVVPDCSFGVGTGMYEVMRWNLDCFWRPNSARGPPLGPVVWMDTASPLKAGMASAINSCYCCC